MRRARLFRVLTLVRECCEGRARRTSNHLRDLRDRGADEYRVFTDEDEAALRHALERAGRGRFWDL